MICTGDGEVNLWATENIVAFNSHVIPDMGKEAAKTLDAIFTEQ
jgi:hypothetical protein